MLSIEGGGGSYHCLSNSFFLFIDDCHTKVVLRTFITLLCLLAFVFLLKMSSCVKQKCVVWYISDANKWAIRLGVVQFKGNNRENRRDPNYLVITH